MYFLLRYVHAGGLRGEKSDQTDRIIYEHPEAVLKPSIFRWEHEIKYIADLFSLMNFITPKM